MPLNIRNHGLDGYRAIHQMVVAVNSASSQRLDISMASHCYHDITQTFLINLSDYFLRTNLWKIHHGVNRFTHI